MRKFYHENSLSIITFAIFFLLWAAMGIAGFFSYNNEQLEQGQSTASFISYFTTGHFWEATFENWESEFLQMGFFVILTAFLYQKGSAESKTKEEHEEEQQEEENEEKGEGESKDAPPWPVRRGGFIRKLYENSLSITLLLIFVLCFIFHAFSGVRNYNAEQAYFGQPPITIWKFFITSDFWFQSFQNWQSEFLAVGAMVVLTIFLRQKGSAESKSVGAPSGKTGES
ncbi:MAG: DUF6766 family protein [Armatimonadota bacterium]